MSDSWGHQSSRNTSSAPALTGLIRTKHSDSDPGQPTEAPSGFDVGLRPPHSPGLSATSARWREGCSPGVHGAAESPTKQLHLGPPGLGCRVAILTSHPVAQPHVPAGWLSPHLQTCLLITTPPPPSSLFVCSDGSWLHTAPGRVYGSGQSR